MGVEAGLFEAEAAWACVDSGLTARCLRIMHHDGAPRRRSPGCHGKHVREEMEAVLDAGAIDRPRLLHGFRATAWPLIEEAARRGYDTRAGL